MIEHSEWLDTFQVVYKQQQGKGGFEVLFPEYRPDLSRALAYNLGLEFYDYRLEKMLSKGWGASEITLDSMTETLWNEAKHIGLVAHNVEALLATKTADERQQWLLNFVSIDWPNPVIIPLAIYPSDTPSSLARVCDLALLEFPKESFLMRLAM
jgi:hypothetical protein